MEFVRRLLICPLVGPACSHEILLRGVKVGIQWISNGGEVDFVCPSEPNGQIGIPLRLVRKIEDAGFRITTIDPSLEQGRFCSELFNVMDPSVATSLLLDGEQPDPIAATRLGTQAYQLLHLQDQEISCDPVFYIDTNPHPIGPKKILSVAKRLAIVVHDTDKVRKAIEILDCIDRLTSANLSVDICIPKRYSERELLIDLASASTHSVRVHSDISRIASLLPRLDLAITTFGSGCLTLANAGVPLVGIPQFSDPPQMRDSMASAGAVKIVHTECDSDELFRAIRSLIRSREKRESLSTAGRQLVDGRGAERIVAMLSSQDSKLRKAS